MYIVHLSATRGPQRGPPRARRGPAGVRRDVPAVPVPLARRHGQRVRGREVHLLAAAPDGGPPARALEGPPKDDLQVVSTDHCPFDFHGQKDLGKGDFRKVPNGLPGVEDRLDLLHDGGVVGGKITKERWVEIVSTAPAKLFGMYPKKGAIAVGADADLVVYDPNRKHTISAKTHHMDVDYSCYEGRTVQGGSDVVMSRGSVVVRNGEFTGRKGAGKFIKRATADYARMA